MAQKNNQDLNYNVKIKGGVDPSVRAVQATVQDIQTNISKINLSKPIAPKIDTKNLTNTSNHFKDLKSQVSGFASSIPGVGEAMALITNPIAGATAALAAFGSVMVSTAKEINEVDKQVKLFTDTLEETKYASDTFRGLKKTFEELNTDELSKAANVLKNEFGISSTEAVNKLEKALIATNGKLELGDIKEFSAQIRGIGGDADTLLTTMSTSVQQGLFSNKSLDMAKDFGKNIRAASDATRDLLNQNGIKGTKLLADVQKGIITQEQAFKEIYGNLDKMSLKQQQNLKSLLGGGGEALGAKGVQAIAQQNKSLDELAKKYEAVAGVNDTNKKLTEAQGKATRSLIPVIKMFEKSWTQIQTVLYEISAPIVEISLEIGKIIKQMVDFGNTGTFLKLIIANIKLQFDYIVGTIKFVVLLIRGWFKLLEEIRNYVLNKIGDALKWIFGEERIKKWKDTIFEMIDLIGAKFNQLTTMISKGFESASAYLDGDFEKAKKLKSEADAAGKALFSKSRERFGGKEEENKKSTSNDPTKTNPSFNSVAGTAMDNSVKSSVSGEVKNVTINMEAVQKVNNQTINGIEDLESFKGKLQEALVSVVADTSQL